MHKDRALLVSLAVLVMAAAAIFLRQAGPSRMPGCLFRKLTDLDCPGCGMTRATHALLHGRISEAFQFNAVGIILFPIALAALGIELLGWVRGKPLPFQIKPSRRTATIIAAVVIGWFILRNVI
jgi:Protein of unknown function (DUF2752)